MSHHDAGQEEHELQEHATPAGQVRSGQYQAEGSEGSEGRVYSCRGPLAALLCIVTDSLAE